MADDERPSRRADAVRNRVRILDAAREQITAVGPGVGMAEIAQAAGVAVGTLYRHFPTKTDLVAAVMAAYTEGVAQEADRARQRVVDQAATPLEALQAFLAFVLDTSAVNHAVKAVAQSLGSAEAGDPNEAHAAAALQAVLVAAQTDGTIRADLTVGDLYLLISSAPLDQPKPDRDRWLELVSHGLLTAPGAPRRAPVRRPTR